MVRIIEMTIRDDDDTVFRLTANMEFALTLLKLLNVVPTAYYPAVTVPTRPKEKTKAMKV